MVWTEMSYNRIELENGMGHYFGTTEYDPIDDICVDYRQTEVHVKEV